MGKKKHERHSESVVEQLLADNGFARRDFQFQGSFEPLIQELLASKKAGRHGAGKPEIICRLNGDANDLLVLECKSDPAFHGSPAVQIQDLESASLRAAAFAEDGVIHYMRGLRREFNVIGLAVSGTDAGRLRISTFRCFQRSPVLRLDATSVLTLKRYRKLLTERPEYIGVASEIEDFAEDLHEFLRDEMELSEPEKPLLVSAVLLGLSVPSFRRGYRSESTGADLAKNLLATVKRKLESEKLAADKVSLMMDNYGFIGNNTELQRHLKETVIRIEENVWGVVSAAENIDLLGDFYGEFLKYSGGDKKGLGIVLTPRHITGLFAKLADLGKDSVLLDSCAGTGGFLIAGMADMIKKAKMDDVTIDTIKRSQLIGIEQNDRMFTLACANMLLRGDGKSNMFRGSCFNPSIRACINRRSVIREKERVEILLAQAREELTITPDRGKSKVQKQIQNFEGRLESLAAAIEDPEVRRNAIRRQPTSAILNPPYAKKAEDKFELAFVWEACEMLEPSGTCVAIVPISCLIESTTTGHDWKRRLLESHTLVAALSMPEQLFPMIGVVTSTLILTAHRPNPPDHETWFGYWRDDGFKLKKGKRVEIRSWADTEKHWLTTYHRKSVIPRYSVLKHVTASDEWCAEAYLEPNYADLSEDDFVTSVREYVLNAFKLKSDEADGEENADSEEAS